MNPEKAFPLMLCINLATRADRWREVGEEFTLQGLAVQRSPGVPASQVGDPWGFQNKRRYACSLAKRLAIRRAYLAGVDAVLIFEDDIVFHPQWRERLAEIELPEDWGLFYLGCRHFQRPAVVSPGLVRCTQATDNHAFAVRRDYFQKVMRGLKGSRKGASRAILYSDLQLAGWQDRIPAYAAYAAYPNLVWQRPSHSDNSRAVVAWYDEQGRQYDGRHCIEGLEEEMAGAQSAQPQTGQGEEPEASPPPAWDWLLDKPPVRNLEAAFPFRRYINLSRREDRRNEVEYRFAMQSLAVERSAAVDARWLRNARGYGRLTEYACSLSHRRALREGMLSGAPAVLVFEDDIILHPQFRQLAEALPLPDDWGIFYFGCKHFREPEVISAGIVRVAGAWCMHAYTIRREYLPAVLRELRGRHFFTGGRSECDVALTRLADHIPTYAAYPNLAWQSPGHSNIREHHRDSFTIEGHQTWQPEILARTNLRIADWCAAAEIQGEAE